MKNPFIIFELLFCILISIQTVAAQQYKSFEKSKLYGVIDKNGNVVIEPIFKDIAVYDNGIIAQNNDDKFRLIGIDGKPKLDKCYRSIKVLLGRYEDGIREMYACKVEGEKGKFGILLSDGSEILPPIYDEIYWDEYADYFRVSSGSKEGVVALDGHWVLPLKFDDIFRIFWCEISPEGPVILCANVRLGIEEYLVDTTGAILKNSITRVGAYVQNINDSEIFTLDGMDDNDKMIYRYTYMIESNYSPKGKTDQLVKNKYDILSYPNDSLIPLSSKYQYIGNQLVYNNFLVFGISGFRTGFLESNQTIRLMGQYGLINLEGKEIIPAKYNYIGDEWGTMGVVAKGILHEKYFGKGIFVGDYLNDTDYIYLYGGKWGALGKDGEEFIPLIYDKVQVFSLSSEKSKDGRMYFYACKKGQQWEIFNEDKKVIGKIKAEYLLQGYGNGYENIICRFDKSCNLLKQVYNLETGKLEEDD